MMTISVEDLNENQRQAVAWDDGPMLVLAGPGSGKTRVLTVRIARILERDPDARVLALTFTNKAAAEMRERLDVLLGRRAERAHLCTFHAYATEILRQHGSHVGARPDFTLLTLDEDRLALLEPVVRDLDAEGHGLPTDRHGLLRLLDHLFREAYAGGPSAPGLRSTPPWVPEMFERYCAALVAANRQDFGSLLHLATRVMQEKPAVARVLRIGWSHVCVDEFQDTNEAQYQLLRLLVPSRTGNLFVVGDDDQIVYQWNGASPERLQTLTREYEIKVVQLPENYRCPSEIIGLANLLIGHNRLRTPGKQPLMSRRPPSIADGTVRLESLDDAGREADFVAHDIRVRGKDAANCAVLARTGKLLEGAAEALKAVGLPPHVAKKKVAFETPPVCVLLLALRLANARHDRDVLRRLCVAWQGLSGASVEAEDVVAGATLLGGDFLRSWAFAAASQGGAGAPLLARVQQSLVDRLEFPGIVDWFLETGASSWESDYRDELPEELDTWRDFHQAYKREHGSADFTLHEYLQSMDLASKVAPPPPGAIRCLTVHGAKGLEFKHVYLIGMAQEVLPSFQALKKGPDSGELEEERRNCFVAITRAQESLTLTCARSYNGYRRSPSQFLAEMGLEVTARG